MTEEPELVPEPEVPETRIAEVEETPDETVYVTEDTVEEEIVKEEESSPIPIILGVLVGLMLTALIVWCIIRVCRKSRGNDIRSATIELGSEVIEVKHMSSRDDKHEVNHVNHADFLFKDEPT